MENIYYGNNIEMSIGMDNSRVFLVRSDNGTGTMTHYEVFPGVKIIYNDFHMSGIKSEFVVHSDIFCVDHCREGRIEQEIKPGIYRYIEAGDLRIDNRFKHNTNFYFPLSHYHGITISFDVKVADKSIHEIFPDFPVSTTALRQKYCKDNKCLFIRSESAIEHIFSELYNVPQDIKNYYFKIKIFELLLYLGGLEISDNKDTHPYFYKSQTEKVKAIHTLITFDLQKHYTLNELSSKFDISLTGMKNCFKAIYGDSIYSYIRKFRMNKAATLLRTTKMNVAKIAGEVGYDNPSKFSAAFKKEINMLPLEYRNTRKYEIFPIKE